MNKQTITCPKCKNEIEITEAIGAQMKENLQKEMYQQFDTREKELQEKAHQISINQEEIQKQRTGIEAEIKQRLQNEIQKEKEVAVIEAQNQVAVEIKDMKSQLLEKSKKLQEAEVAELEIRKKQRDLEYKQKNMELEVARKIDDERKLIKESTEKQIVEEQRYKFLEKDKQIQDMAKQIDQLKRKSEQGSQKNQGEVVEIDFEETLRTTFSIDFIEAVSSGIKGADIKQTVNNNIGRSCGLILWEIKQTLNWSDSWVEKLKGDQRTLKAEIAVIMSVALPQGIDHFGLYNGVWVTDYQSATSLTAALRLQLIQTAKALSANEGKEDKKELLYNYLTGIEFKQRVEAVAEPFISMQEDLTKEKRAITAQWSKREKNLEKVILNLEGMYGDLQGLAGTAMPRIKSLDMELLGD